MLRKFLVVALTFALAAFALCSEPTAETALKSAQAVAKKEHKSVMVIFHASWCIWCHRLDSFLADPETGKIMKKYFVVQHIDVEEQPDKKDLENAGGDKFMEAYKGKDAGLPFTVMLDASGKMLINSNREEEGTKGNVGYPAEPDEIAHFMAMLKAASPKMPTDELAKIEQWFKSHPRGA